MKNILLSFLGVLIFTSSFAQNEGVLSYKLITKNTFGNNEVTRVIYFKGSKSIELGVPKKVKQSSEKISETEYKEVKVIQTKRNPFIYKDFNEGKLLLSDYISTKLYLINDTLNNFKWKIYKEYKVINKLKCKKATTNFRGRNYVAWFSEDIALQSGPWKFCGLPGLVVKVSDDQSNFTYELIAIDLKVKFDHKIIAVPIAYKKDKAVTHKEFRALYKKKLDDYIRLSRVEQTTPDGIVGKISIQLPEKQEKF